MNRSEIYFPRKHEALRDDVHALGTIVGEMLREQGGVELIELVEQDRVSAIRRRESDDASLEFAARVRGRPPALARDLVRAFSAWFQAVNLAEKVHRIRRRRGYFLQDGARPQPGGVADALEKLKDGGSTLDDVLALLKSLHIEPVFAAHPTESTRRTILRKQQRVARLLLDRLNPSLTPAETRGVLERVRAELTAAWQTEDHPREKLTVADEREHVLFYLAEILYEVVPAFYDEVAQALEKLYDVPAEAIELPTLVRFGSWVGGDLDGNPDVHAKSIRDTLARQRQVIINAYFEECQDLAQKLSQSASRISVSPDLSKRIDEYLLLMPSARAITPARHDRMPYRVFLAQISERLRHSYEGRPSGYQSAQQFRADMVLIAQSLRNNRGVHAGLDLVQRLLRRIDTFGFHLATLDVRQSTTVHQRVLAQGLGDPDWLKRPAAERRQRLAELLESDEGPRDELDVLGKRTLSVFEALVQARHRHGTDAIGYFIVSDATGADDLLGTLVLARWAEAYDKRTGQVSLDLAPSFDSMDALERCGETMRELLADECYRRHLDARGRRQCVLIGYSDSNKEGGPCAARFHVYQAQRTLAQTLSAGREEHIVFHGRGGSIPRGGGRVDALLRSAPPEAVNTVLRLTEEGEVINQSYGLRSIAMRTLERAFNALTVAAHQARQRALPRVDPAHLACAATVAEASRRVYEGLVWAEPEFPEYFLSATPLDVIERMQIGSRPAYRGEIESLEMLRPVPWVFAWTQSRHMLPGWFGAGTGLRAAIDAHGLQLLRRAYAEWFFFRSLLDDIETMLARVDLDIAQNYDGLAREPLRRFGARIRAEYSLAVQQVLAVKDAAQLLDGDPTLQRSIQLRNPYVDPMNLMQVDLLKRWRATGRADRDLFEALLASIGGIAQGLQSTG